MIEKWRSQSWSIHAVLASLFWGAIGGLLLVWPALMGVLNWPVFVIGGVVLSGALAAAKFFHRPGAE